MHGETLSQLFFNLEKVLINQTGYLSIRVFFRMFYKGQNDRLYDIAWDTDFASLLIAVEQTNSSPKERLSEGIYFT